MNGSRPRAIVYDLDLAEVIPCLEPPDLGLLALGISDANFAVTLANVVEDLLKLFRDVALRNHWLMRYTQISLQIRNDVGQEAVDTFIHQLHRADLLLNASPFSAYHWLLSRVLLIDDCSDSLRNGRVLLPQHTREDFLLDGNTQRV